MSVNLLKLMGPYRRFLMRVTVFLLLSICLSACLPGLRPVDEELRPWTLAMAESHVPEASLATYKTDEGLLVFAAVDHSNRLDSPTFALIKKIFGAFHFDVLVIEGFETSEPQDSIRNWALGKEKLAGVQEGGEAALAILSAMQQGASVVGGEPSDAEMLVASSDFGLSKQDLLGFYTLRSIPQWIREGRITGASDPALPESVDRELEINRDRLGLSEHFLPNYISWRKWYERINDKPFGHNFDPQEAGPSIDGQFGSNKIGASISQVRAVHLHKLMIDQLNSQRKALVVFGSSHLLIHRPALDHVLGSPCYVGANPEGSATNCNIESTVKN